MRLALIFILFSGPAFADACHDLWFTRNLIMDRAGHCFGSVLGQAQFDNSDCKSNAVTLDAATAQAVSDIRAREQSYGCAVNTRQPVLDLIDRNIRLRMEALPIADELESACLGYRGRTLTLHSAPYASALTIGQLTPGDWISFGHLPHNGWTYVTTHADDWSLKSGGWLGVALDETSCDQIAG